MCLTLKPFLTLRSLWEGKPVKKVNLEEEPLLLGATEGGWGSLGFVSNRLCDLGQTMPSFCSSVTPICTRKGLN